MTKETLIQKLLKYSGRAGMTVTVVDVVQSFFTNEQILKYVQDIPSFDAYVSDAVFFSSCMFAELNYRRSVKYTAETERNFNESMNALERMKAEPIEKYEDDDDKFFGGN